MAEKAALDALVQMLGVVVVTAPLALVLVLGGTSLLRRPLSERFSNHFVQTAVITGLLASVLIMALMLVQETRHVVIGIGDWISIPSDELGHPGFRFSVTFLFDRLSVPLVILSFVLSGTIGAFASRYMHREPGYNRFFVLYAIFVLGMVLTSVAGTIEVLFTGWELVGLSSALLVAFFQDRPAPARNGQRVWIVYRVSDAALVLAAVVMHHWVGSGDFDMVLGKEPWPEGVSKLSHGHALIVGLCLLVAAAGKSALVPFSGWLPRAMEGPTPSSAVFYGALSVHLGAFLLLRIDPLLNLSPLLSMAVVVLGLTTAVYAYLAGSVQTDIKSALSFASLAQVGIIVAEIGFGLRYFALVHLLGHACLRTLQFVRAPTLLHDYRNMENALGSSLPRQRSVWARWCGAGFGSWLYRLALERGYLDAFLNDYVARPFLLTMRWCDGMERRWTDFLAGQPSRESDEVKPDGDLEELG
jgi:NAD(P)H-quinone oxidoreductase subunit 5